MKFLQIVIGLVFTLGMHAQHTVSGNLTPANSFRYLLVYHLENHGLQYITDSGVSNGKFSFTLPNSVSPGTYRLVYAVPQDEYYIDILYNCEEDIIINFDLEAGLEIVSSEENKLFTDYFAKSDRAKNNLMDFYSDKVQDKQEYRTLVHALNEIQEEYEQKSKGTLAHQFIAANRYHLPEKYVPLDAFLTAKKEHYFDHIDFQNSTLSASEFFSDKILNYLFWAIPPGITEREGVIREINKNADFLANKLKVLPKALQQTIWTKAWKKANDSEVYKVCDHILETYLRPLAQSSGDKNLLADLETKTRLRNGAIAPQVTWEDDGKTKTLLGLEGASNYLLIFWSSTCSHCLKELPKLYEELKGIDDIDVVAVGLEDSAENWKKTIPRLAGFHHALALGKWDSEYVKIFAVQQTPTYFILDSNKRFLARPEDADAVIEWLNQNR